MLSPPHNDLSAQCWAAAHSDSLCTYAAPGCMLKEIMEWKFLCVTARLFCLRGVRSVADDISLLSACAQPLILKSSAYSFQSLRSSSFMPKNFSLLAQSGRPGGRLVQVPKQLKRRAEMLNVKRECSSIYVTKSDTRCSLT